MTLEANMTAKMKRAPEFTFQPILLELLVQLTDQWKKNLIKITILHLYDMDAIYEDKN